MQSQITIADKAVQRIVALRQGCINLGLSNADGALRRFLR